MSFFSKKGPTAGEVARENFIKSSITDALAQTLKTLQGQYVHTEQPIYSEDSANAVCNVIEAVFLHGLKSSFSTKLSSYLVGVDPNKSPQPCFWELLKKFTHKDVFSQLNHLGQITTEIGMCRAWIRIAINDGVLESYLDAMLVEPKTIRYFYNRTAYLRDAEHPGILKTYIQGLQNFRFQLSYNSSMLNIFTTTPLVLAGIEEAQLIPQSSMIASRSDEAVSAYTSDAIVTKKTSPVKVQHGSGPQKTSGGSRVKASTSMPDGLTTPPNTPFDNTMLTRKDIDEIRRLGQLGRDQYSVSSTPTSQISCPDPTDSRQPLPIIEDIGPIASGVSKSKRLKVKSSKIKSMFPAVITNQEQNETTEDNTTEKADSTQVPNVEVGRLKQPNNLETTSLSSYKSNQSDRQLDTNSISSAERFFSPTESQSETSSMADVLTDNIAQFNNVHVLEEETDEPSNEVELTNGQTVWNNERTGSSENGQNRTSSAEPINIEENARPGPSNERLSSPSSSMPHFNMQRRKSKPLEPILSEAKATSEFVEIAQDAALQLKFSPSDDNDEPSIYDMRPTPPPQGNKLGDMGGWSSPPNHDTYLPHVNSMADLPDRSYVEREIFADIISAQNRPTEPTSTTRGGLLPNSNSSTDTQAENVEDSADCKAQNQIHVQKDLVSESVPVRKQVFQPQESFNSLVQNYGMGASPTNVLTISQVINQIPGEDEEEGTAKSSHKSKSHSAGSIDDSCEVIEEYEIVPHSQHLVTLIGELTTEKGLDQQNYQCKNCARPIGMIYGNPRLCSYDSCYYCYECHENQEHWIPSRIVHNWDFQKYKVSNKNLQFLKQTEEEALLHVQNLNPRLYEHVPEISDIQELRLQLRFLKAYLFTCKQSVADDLRKQVWPKEYLYDDIHLYSLQDLIQITTGTLALFLKKVIKEATKHIQNCRLCSQKGFICEICNSPKVIYPFERETTVRCEDCGAVYHKTCRAKATACPKCRRFRQRKMSLGNSLDLGDSMDYAIAPNTEE